MRVRATKRGYFELTLREPGEDSAEFDIPDLPVNKKTGEPAAFSENWMVEIDPVTKAERKTAERKAEREGKAAEKEADKERKIGAEKEIRAATEKEAAEKEAEKKRKAAAEKEAEEARRAAARRR